MDCGSTGCGMLRFGQWPVGEKLAYPVIFSPIR